MDLNYTDIMTELKNFRDQRHWQQYHTLPELARAMMVEAGEVNECFLWSNSTTSLSAQQEAALKLELADVLTYLYYMCDKLNVTPNELVQQKFDLNQHRHWKFDY